MTHIQCCSVNKGIVDKTVFQVKMMTFKCTSSLLVPNGAYHRKIIAVFTLNIETT